MFEYFNNTPELIFGTAVIATLITLGIIAIITLLLALYIYFSLAWMTIAKKLRYKKPWFARIPVVNLAMILQLGGFHWAWTFLILIPILGWGALFVLLIIATWKIFEKRKYPGWFSLSMIIPKAGFVLYLVTIGFVAWQDRRKPVFR